MEFSEGYKARPAPLHGAGRILSGYAEPHVRLLRPWHRISVFICVGPSIEPWNR